MCRNCGIQPQAYETQEEKNMKLNAPKKVTWFIGLALVVVALIVKLAKIATLAVGFWLAIAGAVVLLLATFFSKL